MPELVELVPYDASWPGHFLRIADALKSLLGSAVIAIEHIGSTAIPGLSAKPMIDVDVILPTVGDVLQANSLMVTAGYEPRGNRYDKDVFAFMKRATVPKQRIYLCPEGSETHRRRIVFRNYLIAHPETSAAYEALKLSLAVEFAYDGDGYTAAKASFVSNVVDTARAVKQ
ncbi:GrpB-like predicted nucleotidyltransferase (UPF0157 family) [Rhizobium tibeticum]|uniref:GrpB family protein n=1 Tax=Rhizobium tibeticum TaxID=501024 RepID=UPI00278897D0|nr:GrpB family protein [Rhizobium tibeticum]MDP9811196.1 GrpB-like predicted nucleotidyltransferase (UPF0157 family) [Rhizobium tibeticum]